MSGTYVTDITHYLDETGELADMPSPAKKLASFLVLVIDSVTAAGSADYHHTQIKCRKKGCSGFILALLNEDAGEIVWHCPVCGHNGVIRNWQNTKWDQRNV